MKIMSNQINVISPYWLESAKTWVFDDAAVGLHQEPFVEGVPEMIDWLVRDISNVELESGFRLLFSADPFPGAVSLTRLREESGGNWYRLDEIDMEGWICPALFRYFDKAPAELYVKAEAKSRIKPRKARS